MRTYHQYLFSIYPILFLYSINLDSATLLTALGPMFISFIAATAFFLIISRLTNKPAKSALITTLAIIAFYSFGHAHSLLYSLLIDMDIASQLHGRNLASLKKISLWSFLGIWIAGFLVGSRYLLRINETVLKKLNASANGMSIVLILLPLGSLVLAALSSVNQTPQTVAIQNNPVSEINS